MTDETEPPAPGWWQAPDGGWHPPSDPQPEPSVGDQLGKAAAGKPDLTPEGIAARGAKKSDNNAGVGCLVVIVIIGVLWALGSLFGGDDDGGGSGGGSSSDDIEYGAFDVCTQFVKDRLRAPATASFRNYFEDDGEVVVTGGPTVFTVRSSVDSENGFGAKIRSNFVCEVRHTGGESFRLVDLQLVEP